MRLAALLLAAALPAQPAGDAALREALELLYDGGTDGALARLQELVAAAPQDPLPAYISALALCWKIEQRPESTALDAELHRRAQTAIALAEARLRREPADARALLARAGGWGAKGRLQLLRREKRESARSAVRMREDLLALRALEPDNLEASFGLGLYDYYADVLPKLMRLLRLLTGIPGGDRVRGLASIERARQARLHDTEARAQLFEIYAFYEDEYDRAHEEMLGLRRRYPGSPLWALKLAELERDRMGLCAESAQVAREILAAVDAAHPNYAPIVGVLARLSLGESLLLDLRPAEARQALLPVPDAAPALPALGAKARLLLGRSLELDGDQNDARAQYRLAAASADRETRRRAQQALDDPQPAEKTRALDSVARARRLREAGRPREAAQAYRRALAAWPGNHEAALGVAEDELALGRIGPARAALEALVGLRRPDPPWLEPWAWLLLARARDLAGERAAALEAYARVRHAPLGREDLRRAAQAGLEAPYRPAGNGAPGARPLNHSR